MQEFGGKLQYIHLQLIYQKCSNFAFIFQIHQYSTSTAENKEPLQHKYMLSYSYKKFHCRDKMISHRSYLHKRISSTVQTAYSFNGLVQNCSISSALALEIQQSCAEPWISKPSHAHPMTDHQHERHKPLEKILGSSSWSPDFATHRSNQYWLIGLAISPVISFSNLMTDGIGLAQFI